MKPICTMLLFMLFTACLSGQCSTAVTVQTLPFYDTFCTSSEIEIQSPESNDCYDCINNANWYRFQVVEGGGLITLEVAFDLCTPSGTNCGNVNGYYWLFDGCPEGELLSVPSLGCWGDNIMLSCWWPWYVFDTLTCFSGPPETSSGGEFNFPPSNHYQVQLELEEGDYYIAVAPSGTCDVVAYGCIELEFSGPIFLGYVPEEAQEEEEEEPKDGVYVGPDFQPYILKDGVRYTIFGTKQINQ